MISDEESPVARCMNLSLYFFKVFKDSRNLFKALVEFNSLPFSYSSLLFEPTISQI